MVDERLMRDWAISNTSFWSPRCSRSSSIRGMRWVMGLPGRGVELAGVRRVMRSLVSCGWSSTSFT